MKVRKAISIILGLLVPIALGAGAVVALNQMKKPERDIPTVALKRGNVEMKVHTYGELRAVRSAMLVAPPVGGTLQIVRLAKTASHVKANDVLIEFDPSEQEHILEQNRFELRQAEQEIAKGKADAIVQAAQDQVALLKARYEVRRAELEVSRNELVSSIDAKKNLLTLEETKRRLEQLEQDIQSRAVSNQASQKVLEEKRNKAQLLMQQAQKNIENMRVTTPIGGLVAVQPNRDIFGGPNFGLQMPEYREGDQVGPGRQIVQVHAVDEMEISAKVNESDRANFNAGQAVQVLVDAIPGKTFGGKTKTVAGMASRDMWSGDMLRRFDATFQVSQADPNIRPGVTAQVTITGEVIKDALYLPRQALFEKEGKPLVYVKNGGDFQAQEVKIKVRNESQVVVEGLNEGTVVALVNPDEAVKKTGSAGGPLTPGVSR
ncbi:MAG: HlyD family efflux transporter periplasmic adaptor subunit [Acidobacteria bacterium]|nr:HlyD family efflux transporter periplasmic adaptor subunit [Acidobacteriota bacterium]